MTTAYPTPTGRGGEPPKNVVFPARRARGDVREERVSDASRGGWDESSHGKKEGSGGVEAVVIARAPLAGVVSKARRSSLVNTPSSRPPCATLSSTLLHSPRYSFQRGGGTKSEEDMVLAFAREIQHATATAATAGAFRC
jgi:hypothetical protein